MIEIVEEINNNDDDVIEIVSDDEEIHEKEKDKNCFLVSIPSEREYWRKNSPDSENYTNSFTVIRKNESYCF